MGGKTLIGGTEYEIKRGKALVGGAEYTIGGASPLSIKRRMRLVLEQKVKLYLRL